MHEYKNKEASHLYTHCSTHEVCIQVYAQEERYRCQQFIVFLVLIFNRRVIRDIMDYKLLPLFHLSSKNKSLVSNSHSYFFHSIPICLINSC